MVLFNIHVTSCFTDNVKKLSRRCFGQPAAQTHPHLVQEGEVTPGLTKQEFYQRRKNLMEMIARQQGRMDAGSKVHDHIVIIPAAPKVFMSHDIPYPFRQNTDFFYLSGFLEPNSLLVLEGKTGALPDHIATIFVPKKDPHKELWDGPRSGVDGALELTGVDFAFNIGEIDSYLKRYVREHLSFLTWYDYRKPAHTEYHNKEIADFLKVNSYGFVESPRSLIQALRLIKSPAEQNLMHKTCDVASRSFIEVMRSSYPGVSLYMCDAL